jgi:hypothetical protein
MSSNVEDLQIALEGSPTTLVGWINREHLVLLGGGTAFVHSQSFLSANVLIASLDPLIHRYAQIWTQITPSLAHHAAPLLHVEVAAAAAGPWLGVSGSLTDDVAIGLTVRFRALLSEAVLAQRIEHKYRIVSLYAPARPQDPPSVAPSAVAYVAAAGLDRYLSETGRDDYQYKLERVQSLLGLRPAELARILNVSREGLRQWQAGASLAPERKPEIDKLFDLTLWLATHINPEALPSFARRHIPALGGQTPIEWFASRRFTEFRRIFERGFSLEVTE